MVFVVGMAMCPHLMKWALENRSHLPERVFVFQVGNSIHGATAPSEIVADSVLKFKTDRLQHQKHYITQLQ